MDSSQQKIGVKRIRFSRFEKWYLNEETKDITIIVKGAKIPAHKFILISTSEVFERMIFLKKDEINNNINGNGVQSTRDVIEIKDTTPEAFKLLLHFIYFDEFDANLVNKDQNIAIDIYRLSKRFEMQSIAALVEEELMKMVSFDNFITIGDLVSVYKSPKLFEAFKVFLDKNEKQIIGFVEKGMISDPIESIERIINFLNLTQRQVIQALVNISAQNVDYKDWKRFQVLVKFELCSVKDILALKTTRIFDTKELEMLIEQKCDDMESKMKELTSKCDNFTNELSAEKDKYNDLSLKYVEINSKYIEMLANYMEIKELFTPFVEGRQDGRVNQFVYSKTNCYFGKCQRKFTFKY